LKDLLWSHRRGGISIVRLYKVELADERIACVECLQCRHVFALARFSDPITPPVVGLNVKVPSALVTLETPVVRHVPLIAKHPVAYVDPIQIRRGRAAGHIQKRCLIPPVKVDVPAPKKFEVDAVTSPLTANILPGVVVPMPIRNSRCQMS